MFWAMRPYELYGASKATNEPIPAIKATMNKDNTPYLSMRFSGEWLKRYLCFLRLPLIHDTTSCITPNGHTTEQYMRPKRSVSRTNATTTPTLSASKAGKNCILASQPSHVWSVPVKSRNSSVISVKNTAANVTLNLLNMFIMFCIS